MSDRRNVSGRILGLLAGLVALTSMGCEESWLREGDGPDARPTLNVSAPSTVVMVAAERARVVVDLTTNNSRGRALPSSATYAISLSTRYDRPGPAPVVASSTDGDSTVSPRPSDGSVTRQRLPHPGAL